MLAPGASFLARRLGCLRTVSALQMMEQSGSNVRRVEALFEQTLDKLVLALEIAGLECEAQLIEHRIGSRLFDFIQGRGLGTMNSGIGIPLDVADLKNLAP